MNMIYFLSIYLAVFTYWECVSFNVRLRSYYGYVW